MAQIKALLFNDPSCPYGYSASPALRALEWRYRDQIEWHLAVIGLSDDANPAPFPPEKLADLHFDFRRRFGMPFAIEVKRRPVTSELACRVITAARLLYPGSEWRVLRTLQLLNFNTPLLLDDRDDLIEALGTVPGIDARAVYEAADAPETIAAYQADHAHARSAAGGPAHLQSKTAAHGEDAQRFTAPSILFEYGDARIEVGGFQPVEAYDVVVANLDPTLKRLDPAETALDALEPYPAGLTTQEVAAVMAQGVAEVVREDAERELVQLQGRGQVKRVALGNDALWVKA
jgi:2-hydroxychromene-2-carboxylate isomerase